MTSGISRGNRGTRNIPSASSMSRTICCFPVWTRREYGIPCNLHWPNPNGSKIPSSVSRSAPRRNTRKTSVSTTGKSCGTTSSTSSTTSNCLTRTEGRTPRRPTSKVVKARYGYTRNPKAASPTFTARSAVLTSWGASTTITTSMRGHSGRPNGLP